MAKTQAAARLMLALLYIDRACDHARFGSPVFVTTITFFPSRDRMQLLRQKLDVAHLPNLILKHCYCVGCKDHCKEERILVRKCR